MRPIKFKGKRVDNGEWVEGYYRESIEWDSDDGNEIRRHIISQLSMDGEYYTDHFVIPESVCQFTGLQDKSGKDVYEGDVVDTWPYYKHQLNCKGNSRYQPVTFSYGMFATDNFDFGWEGEGCVRVHLCTIIGNIHDNPELLTPKTNSL